MKKTLAGVLAVSSIAFAQNQVDLNINNDTLEVGGQVLLNDHYMLKNDSNYQIRGQYLTKDEDSVDTHVLNMDFKLMSALPNTKGLSFGMGLKGLYAEVENFDGSGVALSGYGEYVINPKFSIDAQLHYGPDILIFSDADGYQEYRANVNFKIVPNGMLFVGYRDIEMEVNSKDMEVDDSAYVGMKFIF